MAVLGIEGLRRENWQDPENANEQSRLAALQALENAQADAIGRDPCTVRPLREYKGELEHPELTRGLCDGKDIYINEDLLTSTQPYQATETLFHESRHADQAYMVANPEKAESPEQRQDFAVNFDAYEDGEHNPEQYLWQPVEADARRVARQRTEELYAGRFQDTTGYPVHRSEMEEEEQRNIDDGIDHFGPDYEEQACIETYKNYLGKLEEQAEQNQQDQNQTETTGEQAGLIAGGEGQAAGQQPEPSLESQEAEQEAEQAGEQQSETATEAQEQAVGEDQEQELDEDEEYDYDYGYTM